MVSDNPQNPLRKSVNLNSLFISLSIRGSKAGRPGGQNQSPSQKHLQREPAQGIHHYSLVNICRTYETYYMFICVS